jgi:hypothetical protein
VLVSDFWLQIYGKINFSSSSFPICEVLLWQPQQANPPDSHNGLVLMVSHPLSPITPLISEGNVLAASFRKLNFQ